MDQYRCRLVHDFDGQGLGEEDGIIYVHARYELLMFTEGTLCRASSTASPILGFRGQD